MDRSDGGRRHWISCILVGKAGKLTLTLHCRMLCEDFAGSSLRLLQHWRWGLQSNPPQISSGQRRMARGLPWSPWQWNDAETGWGRRPTRSDRIPGPKQRNHHRPHGGDARKYLPIWNQQELPGWVTTYFFIIITELTVPASSEIFR